MSTEELATKHLVEDVTDRLDPPDAQTEAKQDVIRLMEKEGVTKLKYSFDGSGDSGGEDIEDWEGQDEYWKPSKELNDALEEFMDKAINQDWNWWDNDGGFGSVTFTTEERKAQVELSIREMKTDDHEWEV